MRFAELSGERVEILYARLIEVKVLLISFTL